MIYIEASEYFIPELQLDPSIYYEKFNISEQEGKVYAKIFGIKNVPIAEETAEQLIRRAVNNLLQKNLIDKKNIKFLIHAYTAGDCAPLGQSIARKIGGSLGLSPAQSFGTNINKCVSIYAAIEMASVLLEQESDDSRILIVTGDVGYTPDLRTIPNTSIAGDAAAALLISKQGNQDKLLHSNQKVFGQYAKGIWADKEEASEFELRFIPMLGDFILSTLEKAELSFAQLRWIVPHNINIPTWLKVAKYIGVNKEKIYLENIEKFAHCFNSDFIINHKNLIDNNLLEKGDYYLCVAAGIGTVLSSSIFQH